MGKSALGLDIGSSSIKIAKLQRTGYSIRLKQYGVYPIPFGTLENGEIKDPQLIADQIRRVLNDLKIKTKGAVIAVAGQTVLVRHIKFPIMAKEELDSGIRFEAERYIPYPIEDACFAYEVINEDAGNNEMEVMIVAAQRQLIESHVQCLKLAGIQPLAVDVQPFALVRALGLTKTQHNKTMAVLDIGAGTSDLVIYRSGSPRFTRIIPIAGNRLTQAVANEFKKSLQEAEKLKIKLGNPLTEEASTDEARVSKAISPVLDELIVEVRRSLDYYRLQQRGDEVDQIVICGGGARLKGCETYFTRELGMRVTKGNPLNLLTVDPSDELFDTAPVLSVGIGLALREVE